MEFFSSIKRIISFGFLGFVNYVRYKNFKQDSLDLKDRMNNYEIPSDKNI